VLRGTTYCQQYQGREGVGLDGNQRRCVRCRKGITTPSPQLTSDTTTAAPRYHYSTVPLPSALHLVPQSPQYHNYRGSSARYCPMLTHSNDCIVFGLKLQPSACPLSLRSLLNCIGLRFSYLFYVGQMCEMTSYHYVSARWPGAKFLTLE